MVKYNIHQLKQIFFKIIFAFLFRSVFISIYGFNQSFLLNLMILCTFSNISVSSNGLMLLKFLIYQKYSVL